MSAHMSSITNLNTPPQNHVSCSYAVHVSRSHFSCFVHFVFSFVFCTPIFGIFLEPGRVQNSEPFDSTRSLQFTMFDPRNRRSHPFFVGAPGAAVSFTQDGSQDRPCMFVQLASSSDSERIFSTMNDIYHGRSWGTCLPYHDVHPWASFALRVGNDLQ